MKSLFKIRANGTHSSAVKINQDINVTQGIQKQTSVYQAFTIVIKTKKIPHTYTSRTKVEIFQRV